jgi:hypothetical protein
MVDARPATRFVDILGLVAFLSEKGGQYPGDLLNAEERALAEQAVSSGQVRLVPGSWSDTDYYCLAR